MFVLRIVLLIVVVLVALSIGVFLRRLLVRRLKKTVLDNWIIQTLGILVILPGVIIALLLIPLVIAWNPQFIVTLWSQVTVGLQGRDITSLVLNILGNVFITLLIIGLGVGIGRTLMKLVAGRLTEQHLDVNIRALLARVLYGIIITIIVFWILSIWQISIGVPVVVISGLTVALTFAVQDILKDLVAGIYLLWERPFHIGDQITTASYTGKVENVHLRATRLRLVSGEDVSIPNALIFGGVVVNNTEYDERRAAIVLSVPHDEFNQEETPVQILKVIKEMENVLVKPEPTIAISHFAGNIAGATGANTGYTSKIVILILRFWIPGGRYVTVTEVMYALHKAFPNVDLVVENSGGDV